MGIFIFTLLAGGVFLVAMGQTDFKAEIEACLKEFDIAEDPVLSNKPLPADKTCYHKCVAQKIGLMDTNGQIQSATFKSKLQSAKAPAEMIAKFDECGKIKKDDPCATAEAVCNCVHGK